MDALREFFNGKKVIEQTNKSRKKCCDLLIKKFVFFGLIYFHSLTTTVKTLDESDEDSLPRDLVYC